MPRYTTTGIPDKLATGSALGLSAFMPHFNRLAASGAQAYKGGVRGYPGTQAIAMHPSDSGIPPSPDPGDLALVGVSFTAMAPNAIYPNLYYVYPAEDYWPGAGMPIQMYNPVRPQDTTMIPVPATDLQGVYRARSANLAGGIDNNRKKALKQAINFVRWPNRRTGNGPGTGSP